MDNSYIPLFFTFFVFFMEAGKEQQNKYHFSDKRVGKNFMERKSHDIKKIQAKANRVEGSRASYALNNALAKAFFHNKLFFTDAYKEVQYRCNCVIIGIKNSYKPSEIDAGIKQHLETAQSLLHAIYVNGGYGITEDLERAAQIKNYLFDFNKMRKEIEEKIPQQRSKEHL